MRLCSEQSVSHHLFLTAVPNPVGACIAAGKPGGHGWTLAYWASLLCSVSSWHAPRLRSVAMPGHTHRFRHHHARFAFFFLCSHELASGAGTLTKDPLAVLTSYKAGRTDSLLRYLRRRRADGAAHRGRRRSNTAPKEHGVPCSKSSCGEFSPLFPGSSA